MQPDGIATQYYFYTSVVIIFLIHATLALGSSKLNLNEKSLNPIFDKEFRIRSTPKVRITLGIGFVSVGVRGMRQYLVVLLVILLPG